MRKNLTTFFSRKSNRLLFLILILGIFLRVYNIENTLLFHYDQGYHGLAIKNIWENKPFTLLGHKTDVEGIFHGSLFYYFSLPIYLISSWDPARVSAIFAFLDALAIVFIFFAAKEIFNEKIGLLASFIYAVSYSGISHARWLSNVTLIPLFSAIALYFLVRKKGKKINNYLVAALFAGIIAQFNGAMGFFFLILFAVYFWRLRKKVFSSWRHVLFAVAVYIIPSIPLIAFDLRNDFLVSSSIVKLFKDGKNISPSISGIARNLSLFVRQVENFVSYEYLWIPFFLLLFILVMVYKKERMAKKAVNFFIPVFITILLLVYYQGVHPFFFNFLFPFFAILFGVGVYYVCEKKKSFGVFAVLLLGIINIFHWTGFLSPNFNLIPIGTRNIITLSDRLQAVDFMYERSGETVFKIDAYIIPYFQEEPWDYVFGWYGLKKYGYLPKDDGEKLFLIYEPDYDYPYRLDTWLDEKRQEFGEPKEIFKSNDLTVEEL